MNPGQKAHTQAFVRAVILLFQFCTYRPKKLPFFKCVERKKTFCDNVKKIYIFLGPLLLDQIFLLLVGWGSLCWNKGCQCLKLTFSYITRGFHPIARMRATWLSLGYKISRDLMTPRHTLRMCASMFSQTCKWVYMCSQACMCARLCSQTCKCTCMCPCMGFRNSLCSQIHMCPWMCPVIFVGFFLPCVPFFLFCVYSTQGTPSSLAWVELRDHSGGTTHHLRYTGKRFTKVM